MKKVLGGLKSKIECKKGEGWKFLVFENGGVQVLL